MLRMQGGPSGSCDFLKCRVLVTCPRFHAANPPPSVATAAGQRTSRGQGGLPCARQGKGQGTGPVPPSGSSFSWALGHSLLDPCSELSGSFRILSLGRSNAAQSPTVISRSRTRLSHLGQTNHTCTPCPPQPVPSGALCPGGSRSEPASVVFSPNSGPCCRSSFLAGPAPVQ